MNPQNKAILLTLKTLGCVTVKLSIWRMKYTKTVSINDLFFFER